MYATGIIPDRNDGRELTPDQLLPATALLSMPSSNRKYLDRYRGYDMQRIDEFDYCPDPNARG